MGKISTAILTALVLTVAASGQGRSHGGGRMAPAPGSNPGSVRSNAPAGTPSASADRDRGTDRAEDVGRGKKVGVHKAKPRKAKAKGRLQ